MCDQRERLIDYIYDECEPADRAAMQQHLETCADCRAEIAALRSVREELQAWEVPVHESVWKPFAPAPEPAWWSQVPRWAMAAAAGLVIASGATGGAVSYALMRQQPVVAAPGAVQAASNVTVNDMKALERRLETRLQQEVDHLNTRVQLFGGQQVTTGLTSDAAAGVQKAIDQQFSALWAKTNEQTDAIAFITNNFDQYKKSFQVQHAAMTRRVESLMSLLEQR
jgi:hypothetical protein